MNAVLRAITNAPAYAREVGREVLRDPVDEMLLLGIAADIGEGQDDDREARRGGFFGRWGVRGLRLRGHADFKRIDPDRLGDVLELGRAEVGDSEIEPPLDLPIGLLGKTDRPRLGDAFEPCGDIDAVAHEIAVAFLDHVAEMDADTKFDALVRRDPSVALDHRPLDFNGEVHCVDDTAELDNCAIAGALDDPAVVHGDGRIDQVASERPQPRQNPVLVGSGQAANSRPRRTPRSRPVFGSRPRRYAAATLSAVSGRPGKVSGGHRKDARGMSIIGLSMAALPCCAEEDVEAGSAALRVDWPVYPRRAEHNTVAEGGNRRWAETA